MSNTSHTSNTINPKPKPKIQKPNRIMIAGPITIYCSSKIVNDPILRQMITRLEQRFHPLKGFGDRVKLRLRELAEKHPDHFPESSKLALGIFLGTMKIPGGDHPQAFETRI